MKHTILFHSGNVSIFTWQIFIVFFFILFFCFILRYRKQQLAGVNAVFYWEKYDFTYVKF